MDKKLLLDQLSKKISLRKFKESGWVEADCPFCGKDGHFGLFFDVKSGYKSGGYKCFKCDEKGTLKYLIKYLKIDYSFGELHDEVPDIYYYDIKDNLSTTSIPKEYKNKQHYDYVLNRVKDKDITDMAMFGGVPYGFLKDYCIFPIKDVKDFSKNHGFVGRDITGESAIRYFNSKGSKFDKLLYGLKSGETKNAILVEGIFDALSVERAVKRYGDVNGYATFGKKISTDQINKLLAIGVENLFFMYDADALKEVMKYSSGSLGKFNSVNVCTFDSHKDPGVMSDREILASIDNSTCALNFHAKYVPDI